ncbi:hypothetical protein [Polaribacter sp. P097]|uniref:hypothetical protein n=1 Tax=Polaribacter sp. P097 TaxID=3117398 RepID=UPI002FE03496
MKLKFTLAILLIVSSVYAQSELYPIGEDASVNFNFTNKSAIDEAILFEAKPIVRYSFYNNIKDRLLVDKPKNASTTYAIFSPHLRMYNENSAPVRMPSYKVALGFQQVWKLKESKRLTANMISFLIENGHYSNGQSGCAFSSDYSDGSVPCNSIYQTINNNQNINLSDLVNRENGHFQTNFTTLYLNHRINTKSNKSISYSFGYTLYHKNMFLLFDLGGYSDNDIQVYGKHRFYFDAEFSFKFCNNTYGVLQQKLALINGSHQSITNYRSNTSFSVFPFDITKNFGFKIAYIRGFDDYNLRFVDNVDQLTVGVVFSPFGIFSFDN